jgi:hypothetical protein
MVLGWGMDFREFGRHTPDRLLRRYGRIADVPSQLAGRPPPSAPSVRSREPRRDESATSVVPSR